MKSEFCYKVKIFFLLIFIFSLPFEYWDPLGIASFFSVTKMAGLFYFILAFFTIKKSFEIKYLMPVIKLLLFLWLWLGLQSIFNNWYGTQFSMFNFTLLQNIILFWLISSDIIRNNNLIKKIFLSLIIGVLVMTALANLGIGLGVDKELGESRLTFFGSNSNGVGVFLSLAFILVVHFLFNKAKYFGNKTYLLLLTIPTNLTMIGLTGSRGALGIVIVGLFFLFLTYKTTLLKKMLIFFIGGIIFSMTITRILESDIMQKRVEQTTEEGSIGGRDAIWEKALDIFYENPLFGHGATGYEQLMIKKNSGQYFDTHNLFLYLMVTGGVIALITFLVFLFQVFKSVLYVYRFERDTLMVVLSFIYLFTVFKAGGVINNKTMWVLLAILFSSKYSFINRYKSLSFFKILNENSLRYR